MQGPFGGELVGEDAELLSGAGDAVGDVMGFDDRIAADDCQSGVESSDGGAGLRAFIDVEGFAPSFFDFVEQDSAWGEFEDFVEADDVVVAEDFTQAARAVVVVSSSIEELGDAGKKLDVVGENTERSGRGGRLGQGEIGEADRYKHREHQRQNGTMPAGQRGGRHAVKSLIEGE